MHPVLCVCVQGRRRRAKRPKEVFRSAGSFTDAELEIEIEDWSDGQWVKQKKNVRVSQSSGSETADADADVVSAVRVRSFLC